MRSEADVSKKHKRINANVGCFSIYSKNGKPGSCERVTTHSAKRRGQYPNRGIEFLSNWKKKKRKTEGYQQKTG